VTSGDRCATEHKVRTSCLVTSRSPSSPTNIWASLWGFKAFNTQKSDGGGGVCAKLRFDRHCELECFSDVRPPGLGLLKRRCLTCQFLLSLAGRYHASALSSLSSLAGQVIMPQVQ
jgi:hypothetical protein